MENDIKTLKDVLPREFIGVEYLDTVAYKYRDVEVIANMSYPWPGSHKNVRNWYLLANGKAVGWNESPTRGWSFPVITVKK